MASIMFISGPPGANGSPGTNTVKGVCKNLTQFTASAAGDGVTDDRLAIQTIINAVAANGGGDIYVPSGTYVLGQCPGRFTSLLLTGSTRLYGAGPGATTLVLCSGAIGSQRLIMCSGSGIEIANMTLYGNKANNSVDEHRAGIFAQDTSGLLVSNVYANNFTGDGFTLYNNCIGSKFIACSASLNDRDGIAFTSYNTVIDDTTILGCRIWSNAAQQIDTECAPPPTNIRISNCYVDCGSSIDYTITCSGNSTGTLSYGYSIVGNTIKGSIFGVWAGDIIISSNNIMNNTKNSAIDLQRTIAGVSISNNTIRMPQTGTAGLPAISILGTAGVGSRAYNISITDNMIDMSGSHSSSFGIITSLCSDSK